MPAVENINGQAITLHIKHKDVKTAADMKGFRFCVPFDFSMHNYLLRYFLAEGGVHPDKDVQIRVVPPAEMVANLKAGNVDGYLGPDPFNQRAVYENVGFIFKLSKDIWDRHPCCAFTVTQGIRDDVSQHVPRLVAGDRRRDALCVGSRASEGNCRGDRADQLLESTGHRAGAGVDRHVCRRAGQHQEGAEPHRFRSVSLAFDGDLDSDANETVGTS